MIRPRYCPTGRPFFGLLISLSLVAMGLWMSGLPLLMALIFTFGAMVLYLGLTRAVAEGGLPAMRPPITTASFLIAGAGTSSLGAEGLVALGFTYGWHAEIRSFVMSSVANGLKISQTFKGSKRRLFWVIIHCHLGQSGRIDLYDFAPVL